MIDTGLFICSTWIEAKHSTGDTPLREKLSHEFGRTEIERFSNCHSFWSFMISLQAERRQRIPFNVPLPLSRSDTLDPSRRHRKHSGFRRTSAARQIEQGKCRAVTITRSPNVQPPSFDDEDAS
jgi:hypothetical protein